MMKLLIKLARDNHGVVSFEYVIVAVCVIGAVVNGCQNPRRWRSEKSWHAACWGGLPPPSKRGFTPPVTLGRAAASL